MMIDLLFIGLIMATGAIASFASGLFGIGGGVVLVPVFVVVFEQFGNAVIGTHTAIGTSLAIVIPNATLSVIKQHKLGNIDYGFFRHWSIGLIAGVILGGVLMFFISGIVLKLLFLGLLCFSLASLIFKSKDQSPSNKQNKQNNQPSKLLTYIGSFIISGFSVLMGVGGGTFIVPYCKSVLSFPMKKAIATSSLSGLFIGVGGTILAIITGEQQAMPVLKYSIGYVNILAILLILPFSLLLPSKGVAFANKISEDTNRYLFIGLLCVCIIIMIIKIF